MESAPEQVEVAGGFYPIRTGFRDWISFFSLHEDEDLTAAEKMAVSLHWYTEKIPDDVAAAYLALQKFAACETLPKSKRKKSNAGSPPAFSYLYDSTYLFADFIRYYQINLQTVSLHWFVFQALLEGLPEDSCTKQRIAYRCINLGAVKDKKERNRLAQIQRAVAIPRRPMTAGEVGNLFG